MDSRNRSIIMLPWLAHGHISPFLELSKALSRRNFNIYLCSTPINLDSIKKKITQNYSKSIQLVELHLPNLPDLPPHYHTTNGLPPHLMSTLKDAFEMAEPAFSKILGTFSPDLVVYDFNVPWAAASASSRQIPSILFLSSSAVFISFAFHFVKNQPPEKYPFPEIYFRPYEMVRFQEAAKHGKDRGNFDEAATRSSRIILIKTFREIEGKYMDYISGLSEKMMVPTGPLVQELSIDEDGGLIFDWLGKKNESSVVFVSFGSEYFLSREERDEIAYGLELSNVNFIWVVRFPQGEEMGVAEALPDGFLERVGERGMVVEKWAPQANILNHSSTGGFVSHCGWSSVMESVKFGVPIIAMPMQLDQPFIARLINDVGVGMEVTRVKDGKLRREEIADVIRNVMVEKDGEKIREKARELSEELRMKGEEEIDGVVNELLQFCRNDP